ncbi:putative dentin sialophosphoprotein [Rhodotorula toruloides]
MPAQPPTAPCEVCGATTTTNCSSCAQVGIDLFFCSRDCQKLVWCSHKFVCGTGGRAGPIKIPELSAEEIEDLKARADNSMWLEIGGFSSVKADLERFSGRSFEYVLKHLPGPTWSTAELPLKPLLVAAVRSSRLAVCRMNLPPSVSPPVPFFFLAAQQCQVYVHLYKSEMLPPFVSYKSWNDFLIHRLLFTDNFRYDVEGIAALTARLHRRYILWMFDGMGTGDQELADALQNVPLNVFMDPKELLKRRMSPSAR